MLLKYVCLLGLAKSATVLAVDIQFPGVALLIVMRAGLLNKRARFEEQIRVDDGGGGLYRAMGGGGHGLGSILS